MATTPLTFLEKKWASSAGVGRNVLLNASVQNDQRKRIERLDVDTHRSVTPYGRRTLLSLGRWLYWNSSAVRGTINEMADLAVASYIPQFEGSDQAWGSEVEAWLYEHDKICDVRGWPFNMATYRRNLIRGVLIDGDMATMLTETAEGYPMIQVFPSHRIGSSFGEGIVQGGQYDGARITDGVITDGQGRPIAYRVYNEGEVIIGSGTFTDVPARDMFLSYLVETPDQIRGISILGASCFDWQDLAESRRFEIIAQKLGSSIGLIETNETGEADKTKKLLSRSSTNFETQTGGTPPALSTTATETVDGVSIRYHRANSGAKIEAFQNDRPTSNQQAFRDDVIREALHGLGWSFDYSYNPTKIGGASMRVVVDRINRKLECLRNDVVCPAQTRIDGYRIAKVMDNPARPDKRLTLFPFNKDWYRWSYQGPAKVTADAKYQSSVDIEERKAGLKTLAKSAAERGDYWKDLRAQNQSEVEDLLQRADELAKKFNVSKELAITLLQDQSSYSTYTNSASAISNAQSESPDPASEPEEKPEEPDDEKESATATAQPMHFHIDAAPKGGKRSMVIKRNAAGEMIGIEEQ